MWREVPPPDKGVWGVAELGVRGVPDAALRGVLMAPLEVIGVPLDVRAPAGLGVGPGDAPVGVRGMATGGMRLERGVLPPRLWDEAWDGVGLGMGWGWDDGDGMGWDEAWDGVGLGSVIKRGAG